LLSHRFSPLRLLRGRLVHRPLASDCLGALSTSSRHERIEALRRVPALVKALTREADSALRTIQAAKRLVQ
jgi:hypothetical protein